jgi:hypothetical protein
VNWRPRNETEEDLQNEGRVAQLLASKWDCEVHKLSEFLYPVDWVFSRQSDVLAYGEFKKRHKKYDTALLSAAKYYRMKDFARQTNRPVFLIIEWPDELTYVDLSKGDLELDAKIGGNSRGQNGDIEPVVYIPSDKFVVIK